MKCIECQSYDTGECHRYPPTVNGFPRVSNTSWCGEFNEVVKVEVFKAPPLPPSPPPVKEVIVDAIEERKIEESNFIQHQGTDEYRTATKAGDSDSDGQGREVKREETVKKRGWPLGKPRK